MYFKRIFTPSVAHYSYVIGDGHDLTIIDPQPTVDVYLEVARQTQMKIVNILETHRNEDFLSGSRALAQITGAEIYVSAHETLGYEYGNEIKDGHVFEMDGLKIKAIHTPGHTLGHMSYALYIEGNPYMVFTGDACFYGDIGRMDFYGKDRVAEMAEKMYDSIFNKLMPLGEHLIMCPAHGPGSACGENIEERPFSTLGYEKRNNPKLQYDSKEAFIEANAKMMFKPDYFAYMEEQNLKGVEPLDCNPHIKIKQVEEVDLKKTYVIDVRNQHAYNDIHIPGSIYIQKENISSFINWFIPRESNICIVAETSHDLNNICIDLRRIGYTGEISFLAGGIQAWYNSNEVDKTKTVTPMEYKEHKDDYFILDVRRESETDTTYGENGIRIALESIAQKYKNIPKEKNILVVCPTGIRSNIVSSFLKSKQIDTKFLIGGLTAIK